MRRSICVCEPMGCCAGDIGNFRFVYTPAVNLPKGTKLRFDLATKGRPIDWELPQTNVKIKKNVIWAQLPDGKGISYQFGNDLYIIPSLEGAILPKLR